MTPRHRFERAGDRPSGIITLLTDFGISDPSVAMLHGVILACFPDAKVATLSHAVPARDVRHGAFWLARSYDWFPDGTVHLAVVDPGLNDIGRPVAMRAGRHYFVGPDNGLLSAAFERAAVGEPRLSEVRDVRASRLELGTALPSRTLHARDIFAPIAADLASGRLAFADVGDPSEFVATSPVPRAKRSDHGVDGEVICVDHFGNLLTNIEQTWIAELPERVVNVEGRAIPIVNSYFDVEPGAYAAIVNTLGTIEIARRESQASSSLGLGPGTPVKAR